jgi:serine O-acetyltransferase
MRALHDGDDLRNMYRMRPELLWKLSRAAYRRGWGSLAKALKALCFVLFRCVLPAEAEVSGSVSFLHRGMGVVIHPHVRISGPVTIAHGVTVGAGDARPDPSPRVTLEPNSFVGAGAVIMARRGRGVRIGRNAAVGANALVVDDVPDGVRVAAPAAVVVVKRPATPDRTS